MKDYKCRKCKGTDFKWVVRKHPKTGLTYDTRSCLSCRKKSDTRYRKKITDQGYFKEWRKANNKHIREYQRDYYKDKYRVRNAKYSKTLKQRTFGNKKDIIEFYKNCPNGYEVDHIVPINGRNVSGLHTIDNLQYLTIEDNRKKSNKY